MTLTLPDLQLDPEFSKLQICSFVETEGQFDDFDEDAKFGDNHWIHFSSRPSDKPKNPRHVHFDIVRKRRRDQPSSNLETISKEIEKYYQFPASGWVSAGWSFSKEDAPKSGFICALLGVSTAVGGETLTLTGSRMEISGDFFDEIKWDLSRDGEMDIEIDAFWSFKYNDNLFDDIYPLLFDGMKKFGFGETGKEKNE